MSVTTKGVKGWKPIRRGNAYCSPKCGRGCTLAEYTMAFRAAKKLAKTMGPKWKPNTWENMGWHHSIKTEFRNGTAEIYDHGDTFWCDVHIDGRQYHANGSTPREAFEIVAANVKKLRNELIKALTDFANT